MVTRKNEEDSDHDIAAQPDGTSYSRSIVAEPMYYNADGSIRNIPPTARGASEHFGTHAEP